jgi:peptide/nickel transport system substrate-binding protein
MHIRRRAVFALAGALAITSLAACGSSGTKSTSSNSSGVLNVGMPNGPQTNNNNPFLGTSAGASLGYRYMIYEPLVMTNQVRPADPGKPWLATKWTWSDNYSKLALTIRDGVKWSDGQAMTADDVAYTFQLLKDHSALNNNAIPFTDISSSGSTVTVGFKGSQYVNQTKILNLIVVPKHLWSTIANPDTDPIANPVGTGPYTLKTFTPQTVTLKIRDSYWQALPKVAEIRYTSYNDNNAQTTALSTGACEWSFVFIPNYKAVYTSKDSAHYKLWFPPTLGIHGLFINVTRKPFDNPVLRQAMNMVVNRDDIFNQGEAGYFYPAVTSVTGIPTPAGDSFLSSTYKGQTVKIDVAGAKALLTGAGFSYAGSTLKDPTGKPVTITLTDPSGWSDYQTDLEIIKDNLAQIGITATVDKANQDAWTKDIDTGNFDAAMHWTNSGATPYDIYQSMMDGALYKPVGTGGVNGNYGRFQNADATAALQQYANAADDAARATAMDNLQKIMVQQMPVLVTSAANAGGEYSTKNWVGWPDESNPYGPAQPTQINALDIVLHLKPASS